MKGRPWVYFAEQHNQQNKEKDYFIFQEKKIIQIVKKVMNSNVLN